MRSAKLNGLAGSADVADVDGMDGVAEATGSDAAAGPAAPANKGAAAAGDSAAGIVTHSLQEGQGRRLPDQLAGTVIDCLHAGQLT
jgi:hypothetical protein